MVDRLTHRRPQHDPKITRIGQSSNIEGLKLLELLLANLGFEPCDFHRSKKAPQAMDAWGVVRCLSVQAVEAGRRWGVGGMGVAAQSRLATLKTFKRR
jgi:hypothetical protein